MTQENNVPTEPVGKLEVLDLENHRGLYGHFLMASLPEAEISNIIDPTTPVEFNFPVDKVPLDKRNYNPVFENLSHRERQDRWKEVPLFDDAYRQWRAEFTRSMKNIKKDSNRELALKAILPDKDAATFVEADANALFQKFCAGKSDTHKFISQITKHVIDSKINSTSLQALLPDLEWIASGLFGRQTAKMVTRLIDLESQLQNNHMDVLAAFNLDKERIRMPQPDEINVLSVLHSLIPQEKRVPTQQRKPVITADVSKPPPVIAEPDEDEDLDKYLASLKKAPEPTPTPARTNPVPEVSRQTSQPKQKPEVKTGNAPVNSVIELGRGKMDLITELNQELSRHKNDSRLTVSGPPTTLKDFAITLVDDIEVEDQGEFEIQNIIKVLD